MSIRAKELSASKNRIFSALLWRFRYLVCANAEQPAKMRCTLCGLSPHSRHFSSPVLDVPVFLLWNILAGNSFWYSSCAPRSRLWVQFSIGGVRQSIPPPLSYHPPICFSSAFLPTSPPPPPPIFISQFLLMCLGKVRFVKCSLRTLRVHQQDSAPGLGNLF